MKKVVVGLDQSMADTGIAIAFDGKIKKVFDINYKGLKTKTAKRKHLAKQLDKIVRKLINRYDITIIVERIRLHSHGAGGAQFISKAYIKSASALIGALIDKMDEHGLPVYSVDTRSWKAQVLGTAKSAKSKKGVVAKKQTSIDKAIELGYIEEISYAVKSGKNKGQIRYNDNMADSMCIALYGFIPESKQKLDLENF